MEVPIWNTLVIKSRGIHRLVFSKHLCLRSFLFSAVLLGGSELIHQRDSFFSMLYCFYEKIDGKWISCLFRRAALFFFLYSVVDIQVKVKIIQQYKKWSVSYKHYMLNIKNWKFSVIENSLVLFFFCSFFQTWKILFSK